MKKTALLTVIIIIFSISVHAQESETYSNAIGVRLGSSVPAIKNGITFKHFFGNNAVEGILSFGDGTALCGLYELYKPIASVNLQWFIGGGAYVGSSHSTSVVGAAGIIGLDYKFTTVPLNISLDWKPELNFTPKVAFVADGIGFSARITF